MVRLTILTRAAIISSVATIPNLTRLKSLDKIPIMGGNKSLNWMGKMAKIEG